MVSARVRWLILAVSILAYVMAVVNRSSFTALGTVAQQHFGAEATVVSLFVTVQILVYTLAQIPVGILLDTKGPVLVMTCGLAIMGLGQFALGISDQVSLALLARLLVGAGDACIFTCMVRLISEWFSSRQIPTLNQLASLMGQSGQLLAVAPLAALMGAVGWQGTFSVLALASLLVALLVASISRNDRASQTLLGSLFTRRKPQTTEGALVGAKPVQGDFPITEALPVLGPGSSGVVPALKSLLKRPGVRMAFWVHWCTGFTGTTFTLLWGAAFMTGGLGYSFSQSASILSTVVVAGICGGLLTGPIVSRFSRWRVHIALTATALNLLVWAVIIFWQGQNIPYSLMFMSAVLMGLGGPISMVAFDLVRSYAPVTQRGLATGLANMGGFTAALSSILLIGILLDAQGAGSPETYAYEPFKWAMSVILPLGWLGFTMVLVNYRQTLGYLRGKGAL